MVNGCDRYQTCRNCYIMYLADRMQSLVSLSAGNDLTTGISPFRILFV